MVKPYTVFNENATREILIVESCAGIPGFDGSSLILMNKIPYCLAWSIVSKFGI
ncbi:hypothetical protein L521_4284 [Bordetella bronchiseptica MBORD698]|nr:hypothetical protein L521_4284 [Bordetella bronchiseptica MBORD698]